MIVDAANVTRPALVEVLIPVTSIVAARRFYEQVLRAELLGDDGECVRMRIGDLSVVLHGGERPCDVKLVFSTHDAATELARVEAEGWAVVEPLGDRHWGVRDFGIADPDGHRICLAERLD